MRHAFCVVHGCLNSSFSKPELSFYKLPADFERRTQWLRLICRDDLMNKTARNYTVCGEHFNATDILAGPHRKKLKSNSIPSFNLPGLHKKDVCIQTDDTPRKRKLESRKGIHTKVCERPSTSVPGSSTSKRQRDDKSRYVLPWYDDDSSDDDDDDSGDVTNNSEGTLDVERINVTLPEQDEDVPTGYICNVCSSHIKGFRSTCLECADCNLCAACEARGEHSSHYVLRIPAAKAQVDNDRVVAMIRKHIADLQKLKEEISEAEATIKNEIIVKEEAIDEEPAEHFSEDFQSIPLMSYSIGIKEEVSNQDSQYLYFTTNPAGSSNSESVHPAQSEVNELWTSVGHVVNDALVPNVTQASSQCQQQDSQHTVHKPFTE